MERDGLRTLILRVGVFVKLAYRAVLTVYRGDSIHWLRGYIFAWEVSIAHKSIAHKEIRSMSTRNRRNRNVPVLSEIAGPEGGRERTSRAYF